MEPFLTHTLEHEEITPIDWRTPFDNVADLDDAANGVKPSDEDTSLLSQCPPGILGALLRFIIPPPGATKRFRVAQIRLLILANMVGVEDIAEDGISKLADKLGLTRSALSHWSTRMADELGEFTARGGRTRETRALNSARAAEVAARLGHGVRHGTSMSPEEREKRRQAVNASRRKAKERTQSV